MTPRRCQSCGLCADLNCPCLSCGWMDVLLIRTKNRRPPRRHWARELLGVEPVDNGDGTETVTVEI